MRRRSVAKAHTAREGMCVHLHHMPAKLTITIPDDVMSDVEAQKPRTLSLASFCALLIDRGLTNATDTQIMGEPAARRASLLSNKEILTNNKSVSMVISEKLEPFEQLIREFWKIKKGSKGQTSWSRLMGQLSTLLDRYGSTVTRDQLELAINGKWAGIEVSRYESFLPKGITPKRERPKEITPEEKEANHQAWLKKMGLDG